MCSVCYFEIRVETPKEFPNDLETDARFAKFKLLRTCNTKLHPPMQHESRFLRKRSKTVGQKSHPHATRESFLRKRPKQVLAENGQKALHVAKKLDIVVGFTVSGWLFLLSWGDVASVLLLWWGAVAYVLLLWWGAIFGAP